MKSKTSPALVEVPVTTVELAGRRMAAGGGGFFRLLPYGVSAVMEGAPANAPLAYRVSDIASHGVLEGQAVDPDHPDLLASPCRGILPESAFDPLTAADAWARFHRSPPAPVTVSAP